MTNYDATLEQKIEELIQEFSGALQVECAKLARSGMIDLDGYPLESYAPAKIIIAAAIHRQKDCFMPLHNKGYMREFKNLLKA